MRVIRTPFRAPNANAHAERVPVSPRDVRRRDLIGGLDHEYHGLAA
jgi:hypothetical protein